MQLRFMLCGSMDSPEHPLLDEEKIPKIQALENSGRYIFEAKLDGTCGGLGKLVDGTVTIPNRRGVDYAKEGNLSELVAAAKCFPKDTMSVGEIVVMCNPEACNYKETCEHKIGHPCRTLTQRRCGTKNADKARELMRTLPVEFVTWDIPRLNGEDLKNMPLIERKKILRDFIQMAREDAKIPNLREIEYQEKNAVELFMSEPEGIVAKLKDSIYVEMEEGTSSSNRLQLWMKIKHTFIVIRDIIGYSLEAEGRLSGKLRNLVMLDNGRFCGTVGGGFSDQEREQVKAFLDNFPSAPAPYSLTGKLKHRLIYKPGNTLKVKVAYQEVTPANILYAPRMIDLLYPEKVQLQPQPISGACFFWEPPKQ